MPAPRRSSMPSTSSTRNEKRSFIWLNVVSLFFTIGAIAGAGLAVALVVVFPLITAVFGLTSLDAPIVAYLRWPLMFVLIIIGLAVLYRDGPGCRLPSGVGSASAVCSLRWHGLPFPSCFPGTSAISTITMRLMERSARWWG